MDRLSPKLAAVAADKLWQFQLRKENKALLEMMQELERRRESDAAEVASKQKESTDRIIALELRLSEFEREKIKNEHVQREFAKADAAFKSDMKSFLEGRISEGKSMTQYHFSCKIGG